MADDGDMLTVSVRYLLPASVILAGVVLFLLHPVQDNLEGPAGFIGAGLSIWLLNALHRMGVSGDSDRDAEEAARTYFDAHGRWPDEA
jgi:hypothetical protein